MNDNFSPYCAGECFICEQDKKQEKEKIKMAKDFGTFWVVKRKDGHLKDYGVNWLFDTRRECRESGQIEKGDKPVKVRLIEVEQIERLRR